LREDYPENKVLSFIRENVSLERIKEVEEKLALYDARDLDKYFEEALMESVYRGHKGSFKIQFSKGRGEVFLSCILYLLFGEWDVEETIEKHFDKENYFRKFATKFLNLKTGDKTETGWINIDPYVYEILGGEIFFYCTLRALIEISKKALEDPKYDYYVMDWKEGITQYLVREIIANEATASIFSRV